MCYKKLQGETMIEWILIGLLLLGIYIISQLDVDIIIKIILIGILVIVALVIGIVLLNSYFMSHVKSAFPVMME